MALWNSNKTWGLISCASTAVRNPLDVPSTSWPTTTHLAAMPSDPWLKHLNLKLRRAAHSQHCQMTLPSCRRTVANGGTGMVLTKTNGDQTITENCMEKTGCTLGARSWKQVWGDTSYVTYLRNSTTVTQVRPECQRETSLRFTSDKSSWCTLYHVIS